MIKIRDESEQKRFDCKFPKRKKFVFLKVRKKKRQFCDFCDSNHNHFFLSSKPTRFKKTQLLLNSAKIKKIEIFGSFLRHFLGVQKKAKNTKN